jgi:RimJ/RimL family protein N-acetyltransferase
MIHTERLVLRSWRDEDETVFAAATNTPAVMAHLDGVRPSEHFHGMAARQRAIEATHGFCFWLVERRCDRLLLGFCGLEPTGLTGTPIDDDIEIGWRLREDAWGQGYAREAAQAALDGAWATTDLARIVALTVPANRASWRLMERLGMTRRSDLDFDHPAFSEDHPLSAHIVYAISRP